MLMRATATWMALTLVGCASGSLEEVAPRTRVPPGESPPGAPGGGGSGIWALGVDTSDTDPFAPSYAATWPVRGSVTATHGVAELDVGGALADVVGGRFDVEVEVGPGANVVPIAVTDMEGRSRKAHRTVLAADYLPEGALNPDGAVLALDDAILAGMAEGLSDRVAGLDITGEIMSRPTLTEDECVLRPLGARHGVPRLGLVTSPAGELVLEVRIPGLRIDFDGTCSTILFSSDVTGNMETDVVIRSVLQLAPGDGCAAGFEHGPPVVDLEGFDIDISGGTSLLDSLIVSLAGELKEGESADSLAAEFAVKAEELLAGELEGVSIFDGAEMMNLFDTPIEVGLCLTGLSSEGGVLLAHVGVTAAGPGGLTAPGAPVLGGDVPGAPPGTLLLDAGLVGQLLFSAWRDGALSTAGVEEVDIAVLGFLSRDLRARYPAGTKVSVDIDARLPPLCVAAEPGGDADLILTLGDLRLTLRVGEEVLFVVGTRLDLELDLVPTAGGALSPELVGSTAEAWLLAEPVVDVEDETLESILGLQVADAAAGLLEGTEIRLPDLGGALAPSSADPVAGGRYVAIGL